MCIRDRYMLNCGMGCVFLLVGAIAALVKAQDLLAFISQIPEFSSLSSLLVPALVCLVVSMNVITAPSISLEGRNLWPVSYTHLDVYKRQE